MGSMFCPVIEGGATAHETDQGRTRGLTHAYTRKSNRGTMTYFKG